VTAPAQLDRFAIARSVADAVLYEGYVLYPYRASSRKNQVRFQWGVLTPRAFSEAEGSERWSNRTECLVEPGRSPQLTVRVRCLQSQHRTIEALGVDGLYAPVEYLEVDGTLHVDWDEALDQVVDVPTFDLAADQRVEQSFTLPASVDHEEIRSGHGALLGRFVRIRQQVTGMVRITTSRPDPNAPYLRVAITVENRTSWTNTSTRRDEAIGHSLIAVHTMAAVDDGRFVSLLDPSETATEAARACRSDGSYPVLIGDDEVILASPIILYDHPEVAAQSPGDLYDSLEIDEILALRVMTLTDEEKAEARGTDPRAAAIIDRCDNMSPETLSQLHGQMQPVPDPYAVAGLSPTTFGDPFSSADFPSIETLPDGSFRAGATTAETESLLDVPWWDPEVDASYDPWTESVWISGVEITKGSAVRLEPTHRSDAHDIFLRGMNATVAGVFTDVDGDQHVAVTVDDDPATEELQWQGRFLFFHPDEVAPLVRQSQEQPR
jgi:hypothetical protein